MPGKKTPPKQPAKAAPAGSEPVASRPHVPGYGIPTDTKGVLPWSFADERLAKSTAYWVCTIGPDGKPHAVPIWGVWVDGAVCFGGSPEVRWARNLSANPRLSVHLESGDEAVILEGRVDRVTDPKHPLVARVISAYKSKYKMPHPPPFWVLRPRRVFGWTTKSRFQDATRWKLEGAREADAK